MTTGECIHSPIQGFCSFFLTPKLRNCDETLPIINKPKHPKEKGKYKEQNARTHVLEDKGTTSKGKLQRQHQVPKPLSLAKSISNKERGGPPQRRPSLNEPSPNATTCSKIEIICACCNAPHTVFA
jgi:hypothetical protein